MRRSAFALLGLPGTTLSRLRGALPQIPEFPLEIDAQLERDALYSQYLGRQDSDMAAIRRDEDRPIPESLDYLSLPGLSRELAVKLARQRPVNLAQAAAIEGMTPAALVLLLAKIHKKHVNRRAV